MDVALALGLVALAFGVGLYGTVIGAGGGFLMIPALILLFDLDGAEAVGTGAVALTTIGLSGAIAYDRKGMVERSAAGWFALGSVPVALLCAWQLANRIDGGAYNLLLGLLLIGLAALVIFGPRPTEDGQAALPARPERLMPAGALLGAMSGTFAVGAGLITIPVLSRLQRLSAHRATATTSATAACGGLAGSLGHTIAGNVRWTYALALAVGAFLGSRIAATKVHHRLSANTLLGLVAVGLIAAAIPLLINA